MVTQPAPPAPTVAENDDAKTVVAATPSFAASTAANPNASNALTFHFNEESWVEVRGANGTLLLKRLNAAGSEQVVEGEAPFTLIVGNAKGVDLQFRGQAVDLAPHTRDSVARLTLS